MNDSTPSPEAHAGQVGLSEMMAANTYVTVYISKISPLDLFRDDLQVDGMDASDLVVSAVLLTEEAMDHQDTLLFGKE